MDIEIVGDRNGVQAMLMRLETSTSPVGLAAFLHGAVGPMVLRRATQRFENEGDDVSGKWAPLANSTVEIREKSGFGAEHPINKRTGELEAYITGSGWNVTAAPAMATLRFPGKQTSKRSVREKMKTAQQGRSRPSTVPRPVLGLNEQDLLSVMTMLAFYIKSGGVVRGS